MSRAKISLHLPKFCNFIPKIVISSKLAPNFWLFHEIYQKKKHLFIHVFFEFLVLSCHMNEIVYLWISCIQKDILWASLKTTFINTGSYISSWKSPCTYTIKVAFIYLALCCYAWKFKKSNWIWQKNQKLYYYFPDTVLLFSCFRIEIDIKVMYYSVYKP